MDSETGQWYNLVRQLFRETVFWKTLQDIAVMDLGLRSIKEVKQCKNEFGLGA